MKYLFLSIFLFINSLFLISQNIQVKIIDENTKYPVAYAAVKIDDFNGVISNEEGFFTLNSETIDFITVSCLGYKSKVFSIDDIKKSNNIISLEEAINELNTVYISNKRPNVDSIIARTKQRLSGNYDTKLYKHEIFSRQTTYVDFKDFKADLFVNDSTKMVVHKATELLDQKNSLSFDDVQKKGQSVMLKYLDTTLTYKLKTGLFKIEDSLSLKDDSTKNKDKNEYEIDNLRSETNSILKRSQFGENSILTNILDNSLYEYKLENISSFNNELLYVISFKPKRSKSKYSGKLFITDENYAITKVDFEFADGKRGEKFNLKLILGVKYIENMCNGTIIFQKNLENKYQPQYIKYEEGRYFYVSRPLKFIENSPQKNKTSFDFTIEGNIISKEEILLTSSTKISAEQFQNLKEEKTVPYIKLSKYDPTIWDKDQTLEPLEEMKQFNSTEKEN